MINYIKDVYKYNKLPKELIIKKIRELKQKKNVLILAHYYVKGNLQDIADFVGDSLNLAFKASETQAHIILFIGVHFMAETAKILAPEKKVLIPDISAGCPLADSLTVQQLQQMKKKYPNHIVVSYVNTTAEVKSLSDVICTSSNAVDIVNSLPEDTPIIFGPDKNLGSYVKDQTGRNMIIWQGSCPVHLNFSYSKLQNLKQKYPEAVVLAHPECNKDILLSADFIGSTSKIIKLTQTLKAKRFIIATEPEVIHQMHKDNKNKEYIPLEAENNKQSICSNMKKHSLYKVLWALETEIPEITLAPDLIEKAYRPIKRMLDISKQLGIIK